LKLITDIKYLTFPSPYIINRYGGGGKKLALTFDDGPDIQWTPQILDELKKANVKATFFVIGENAETNPSLIKREDAE
jgi:peptidoglycan/xylan/chitin deacetylase (PgdA/CDA1 family)